MRMLPFTYSARNLGRSRLRLLLSIFGSGMVVLLILAAGGFVRGMSTGLARAADERNVLIVGIGSEESIERSEIPASVAALLDASVPGLKSSFGTTFVSPEVHVQLPITAGTGVAEGRLILVRGVTPSALLVHSQSQRCSKAPPYNSTHTTALTLSQPYSTRQHPSQVMVNDALMGRFPFGKT